MPRPCSLLSSLCLGHIRLEDSAAVPTSMLHLDCWHVLASLFSSYHWTLLFIILHAPRGHWKAMHFLPRVCGLYLCLCVVESFLGDFDAWRRVPATLLARPWAGGLSLITSWCHRTSASFHWNTDSCLFWALEEVSLSSLLASCACWCIDHPDILEEASFVCSIWRCALHLPPHLCTPPLLSRL